MIGSAANFEDENGEEYEEQLDNVGDDGGAIASPATVERESVEREHRFAFLSPLPHYLYYSRVVVSAKEVG